MFHKSFTVFTTFKSLLITSPPFHSQQTPQTLSLLTPPSQQMSPGLCPLQMSSTTLKFRMWRWRIQTWNQPAAAHSSPVSFHTQTLSLLLNQLSVRSRKKPARSSRLTAAVRTMTNAPVQHTLSLTVQQTDSWLKEKNKKQQHLPAVKSALLLLLVSAVTVISLSVGWAVFLRRFFFQKSVKTFCSSSSFLISNNKNSS